jgi:SAM-dependent methyltransferase
LDVSDAQIAYASALADRHGVSPELVCGDMHTLESLTATCYNLILAAYVLPYSAEPLLLAQVIYNCLKPGGRLVASMDHPVRSCFWDQAAGELEPFPVRDYHSRVPMGWRIGETPVEYHHRTVGEWIEIVQGAGLQLERLVEPRPPAELAADYWPADSALAPLAHIPHTLILIASRD